MKRPNDKSDRASGRVPSPAQGEGADGEPTAGISADPDGASPDATGDSEEPSSSMEDDSDRVDAAEALALTNLEQQLSEQREKYLRLAAEYDNYRKRTLRERQESAARGQADTIRGMLEALDDLTRFAHVDPTSTDTKTLVDGVSMVERKLLKTLTAQGLQVLNPVDQTFDPSTMEAVATEPALSSEDDHVVSRVYQQGYLLGGQLLRPARVVVKQWNG
jgi:molecular chaperone GrpE